MTPVNFPEANEKLAKSQPQYRPLPVSILDTHPPEECKTCMGEGYDQLNQMRCIQCNGAGHMPIWKEFTCKYELSEFELAQINLTQSFYFTQSGYGFNPVLPQVENHFKHYNISYKDNEAWVPLTDGTEYHVIGKSAAEVLDLILQAFPDLTAEQIHFYERPVIGIDENGNITEL